MVLFYGKIRYIKNIMIVKELEKLVQAALFALAKEGVLDAAPVEHIAFEHPEDKKHGDYSANIALVLGEKIGKNPRELAEGIARVFPPAEFLERVEVAGPGFLNFFLSRAYLANELGEILKKKEKYGKGECRGKVIIEYSSPNIAKPFGIGHLRSTIIGQAIYNLYKFLGYACVGINYPGDWGTPHGKILYEVHEVLLKDKSAEEKKDILENLSIEELERLYVQFHKDAASNPALEEVARNWFKKLEDGDKEARMVWEYTKRVSFREFERIYRLLDVSIDHTIGESFFEDKMDEVIRDFQKRGLATESRGALIVSFPNEELSPAMLLKSDGATTYFTRDMANMKYRLKRWKPSLVVIETGVEQNLHFQQVFLASRLVGYAKDEQFAHVYHGLYRSKEGKFSTRKGETIHLEDVLHDAKARAREILDSSEASREFSENEKQEIAGVVGIGAVKYNDLSQHPSGDIVFDWDKMLNLRGNSAPYLQYTYARCQSILRKSNLAGPSYSHLNGVKDVNEEEMGVLRLLYRFPEVVEDAARRFSPNMVCSFAFSVAQAYNLFYNTHRVLEAETKEIANFRLALTKATAQIIKNCLFLLGIQAPEKM
ncbi:MAG: arginine--tRNA ligase [Candidatus Wildermuthbacteria bacterium]|nr:arginine--tRNA ligase [Candidatus Wildermuthbacteria bacterium]